MIHNKMAHKHIFSLLFFYIIFIGIVSCDNSQETEEFVEVEVCKAKKPFKVFGFEGQCRYSYCPSVIRVDNNTSHMYFCGNPQEHIMVDNIYHITLDQFDNFDMVESVLQPGPSGSWDDHHTCDPSVIEGDFLWEGERYKYAMFFLSNRYGVYYNEIGVAFSNDLSASSWKKWPNQIIHKTWDHEGDQSIGGTGKSWGVGQPSAISLDKKGEVLLTYTVGDFEGTRIQWRILKMSNMNQLEIGPANTVTTNGLKNMNGQAAVLCNSEFAVDKQNDKILIIRPVVSTISNYPTYIDLASQINCMPFSEFLLGTGVWDTVFTIDEHFSGYPRNHNAAFERDSFGYINDWKKPVFFYTVSKEAPDVSPTHGKHAEWTYSIWKSSLYTTTVKAPVKDSAMP